MAGPWEAYQQPASDGPWAAYQSKPAEEERGALENLVRGTGLAARSVATAGANLAGMVADPVNTLLNYGLRAANALGAGQSELGMPSQAMKRGIDAIFPKPETGTERVVFEDVAPAVLSGGGIASLAGRAAPAASGATQAILGILGREQGLQAAGNATGALAGGVTREAGGGTAAQLIASLLGGAAPSVAKFGGAATLRGGIRGGEEGRQTYLDRLATFEDAGVTPTAGQAAGTRRAQSVESLSAKAPGGAGVFSAKAEAEAAQMAKEVNALADSIIPNADAAKAGRTVEKGLAAFVDRFKAKQGFLYEKLDKHIPSDTQVDVSATKAALAELNADIPKSPELSQWFKNAKIVGIEKAVESDAAGRAPQPILAQVKPGSGGHHGPRTEPTYILDADGNPAVKGMTDGSEPGLPYEALKKLRTLVGNEITNNSLASDVPRSKWKALYAALSDDMGTAAQQAGPDAERAFARANAHTKAGYERIESTLDRVGGKDTAEKVFQAVVNPSETREGATTVNAVMRSLNPDERKVVTAATIKRLGQATAGHQSADGDVFSTATFLTNWNKISDPARRVLFPDAAVREGMEAFAQAASMIKDGSKVFANPSGSAPTGVGLGMGIVSALNPVMGAKIAAAIGANYGAAKLMTNPKFVKWVGRATEMSPSAIPVALQQITAEAKDWTPEDRRALADFAARLTETN